MSNDSQVLTALRLAIPSSSWIEPTPPLTVSTPALLATSQAGPGTHGAP